MRDYKKLLTELYNTQVEKQCNIIGDLLQENTPKHDKSIFDIYGPLPCKFQSSMSFDAQGIAPREIQVASISVLIFLRKS